MMECPMPGDACDGATVIASGWYTDWSFGLLLLDAAPPFYRLALADKDGVATIRTHFNVVPAAADFDDTFDFWGGS